jgi:hypothetical protein
MPFQSQLSVMALPVLHYYIVCVCVRGQIWFLYAADSMLFLATNTILLSVCGPQYYTTCGHLKSDHFILWEMEYVYNKRTGCILINDSMRQKAEKQIYVFVCDRLIE